MAKRGVVWSIDVIIGLVVFMAAIVAFFILTASRQAESPKDVLADENRAIVNALETSQELSILYLGELSAERVQQLAAMDYDTLKGKLGLTKDFCILFQDAEGNLLEINGTRSIGDPDINYSYEGVLYPCGSSPAPPPPLGAIFSCSLKASCAAGETCAYQLSASSNAHAESCGGLYMYSQCCAPVAGCTLSCSAKASCAAGEDELISLSAATNAHLEDPALGAYGTDICCTASGAGCGGKTFQQCVVYDHGGGGGCAAGYACAGSVSGTTDAHGGACDTYAYNICCPA